MVPDAFNKTGNIDSLGEQKTFKLEETPGFGISVLTSHVPCYFNVDCNNY